MKNVTTNERLPCEDWPPVEKMEEAIKDLHEIVDEQIVQRYGDMAPTSVVEEIQDYVFAQTGGEAKYGPLLKEHYRWCEWVMETFAQNNGLDLIKDQLRRELGYLTTKVDDMAEEFEEQLEDAIMPNDLGAQEGQSKDEKLTTAEDLKIVAEHARHLVEFLDGDRTEVDTDDLRYRLRRLGFSVNLVAQVREVA